jgi:hypothetical protein
MSGKRRLFLESPGESLCRKRKAIRIDGKKSIPLEDAMLLETLSDFLEARPTLKLSLESVEGVLEIQAVRRAGEFSSVAFVHWVEADPMDGLTKPLNEISEALEEHDLCYPVRSTVAV